MVYIMALINSLFRFVRRLMRWPEQMWHRSQGHMLLTMDGESMWIVDIYSDSEGELWYDACNGETHLLTPLLGADTTITGG